MQKAYDNLFPTSNGRRHKDLSISYCEQHEVTHHSIIAENRGMTVFDRFRINKAILFDGGFTLHDNMYGRDL